MQDFIAAFPEQWREIVGVLLSPIAWIPRTHDVLIEFFLQSPSVWAAALKYVLLLFPAGLGIAAIWCTLLFDLDMAIQRLTADVPDHPSVVQLTSVYHNLLRRWAEM